MTQLLPRSTAARVALVLIGLAVALPAGYFHLWAGVSGDELRAAADKANYCDTSAACVVVTGDCGYTAVVNKREADAFDRLLGRHDRGRGLGACGLAGEITREGPPLYPACRENRCTFSPIR